MNLGSTILEMSCSNERMAGFGEKLENCVYTKTRLGFLLQAVPGADSNKPASGWAWLNETDSNRF